MMATRIMFGMDLDGARWSSGTSVGEITCGPLGMLKFLETRLGLGGREVPAAERIAGYMEKGRAVYAADPNAWGAASFAKDSWSTAKRLLAYRDELVLAGWNGSDGESDRLRLLRKIEAEGAPTLPGIADRTREAASRCTKETFAGVHVDVVGDLESFPRWWRTILVLPEDKARTAVCRAVRPGVTADDIVAANEIQLAGVFVRELEAAVAEKKSVAVVAGADTTLLDGFLHRAGLPAIGKCARGVERAAIQILPLWIENMWRPFSAFTMLSILNSEVSPIPRGRVGRRLAAAIRREPGSGGEEWEKAWAEMDAADRAFRAILEAERYDPEGEGVPREEFVRRLEWLAVRLGGRACDRSPLDPQVKKILKATIKDIGRMKTLSAGFRTLNRAEAGRLLESVLTDGVKMPYAVREVAPWTACGSPGQVMEDADVVFWWGFVGEARGTQTYWSKAERDSLACGKELDPSQASGRRADGWYNALGHARCKLKLFHPLVMNGKACPVHPFSADLEKLGLLGSEKAPVVEDDAVAATAADSEEGAFDGTVVRIGRDDTLTPRSVSASQLSTLLSCPFLWYLTKRSGLDEADALAVQTEQTMIGLLAHKVVQLLVEEGVAGPQDAAEMAGRHFDALLPSMAAELTAPDRAVERRHYRQTLTASVKTLWEEIRSRGLAFVAAECDLTRERAFEGLDFTGRADVVLKDASGKPYVIDLKWSGGSHYVKAADAGRSVQLAAYAWAIDPVGFAVDSAYYMFPKKRFCASGQNDGETWQRILDDYRRTIAEMRSGDLHKGYAEGETRLGLEPECKFCPVKAICGKERA